MFLDSARIASVYLIIFKNLTEVVGSYTICGSIAHSLFVNSFVKYLYGLNEYVKQTSLESDVIKIISYLCSRRKSDVVKNLPARITCDSETVAALLMQTKLYWSLQFENRSNWTVK